MKEVKKVINNDKYAKLFTKTNLMDDLKFQQIAKSKEAIEEILRVVLNDKKLKVIRTIPQRNRRVEHIYVKNIFRSFQKEKKKLII